MTSTLSSLLPKLASRRVESPSAALPFSARGVLKLLAHLRHGTLHLEVVRSPKPTKGFAVQPHRWVIERSFAWLTKCRRLVKDYERLLTHSAAFIHLAFTGLMLRSLAR